MLACAALVGIVLCTSSCGDDGIIPKTVNPGPDFVQEDVTFDDEFYYCRVEPVLFAAAHFAAGILIGARLRIGALLIAFAVVLIESIVGGRFFAAAPWWVLLILGIGTLQLGYAAAGAWLAYRGAREAQRGFAPKKLDRVSGR